MRLTGTSKVNNLSITFYYVYLSCLVLFYLNLSYRSIVSYVVFPCLSYLPIHFVYILSYLSVCLFLSLSIYLSIYPSIHLSTCLHICRLFCVCDVYLAIDTWYMLLCVSIPEPPGNWGPTGSECSFQYIIVPYKFNLYIYIYKYIYIYIYICIIYIYV